MIEWMSPAMEQKGVWILSQSGQVVIYIVMSFVTSRLSHGHRRPFCLWVPDHAHPNSGRYSDMLGNYDVGYLAGWVVTQKNNGFCPT